jgi:hypothetical protein
MTFGSAADDAAAEPKEELIGVAGFPGSTPCCFYRQIGNEMARSLRKESYLPCLRIPFFGTVQAKFPFPLQHRLFC